MKRSRRLWIQLTVAALVVGLAIWMAPLLARMDFGAFPERAAWQRPDDVLAAIDIAPGSHVADLGSGDGYFTTYLAEAVGASGKVYAVDVDSEALAAVERLAAERSLAQIETVEAAVDDPRLPDGTVDLVFICNAYHHLDDHVAYFSRLRTDLAPGGRVAIVEPGGSARSLVFSPPGHATSRDTLRSEMEAAGYRHVASHDFLPVQNLEIFQVD